MLIGLAGVVALAGETGEPIADEVSGAVAFVEDVYEAVGAEADDGVRGRGEPVRAVWWRGDEADVGGGGSSVGAGSDERSAGMPFSGLFTSCPPRTGTAGPFRGLSRRSWASGGGCGSIVIRRASFPSAPPPGLFRRLGVRIATWRLPSAGKCPVCFSHS
ncbi:MAG: hypothetical protein J6U40_04175 [Kiritimatiellae bacterium]|nr:hypothetical protein [Kiritimatiellia bacterium]